MTNQGTININADATLRKNNAAYINAGDIHVTADTLLAVHGASTFTQNAGTLDVAEAFSVQTMLIVHASVGLGMVALAYLLWPKLWSMRLQRPG